MLKLAVQCGATNPMADVLILPYKKIRTSSSLFLYNYIGRRFWDDSCTNIVLRPWRIRRKFDCNIILKKIFDLKWLLRPPSPSKLASCLYSDP